MALAIAVPAYDGHRNATRETIALPKWPPVVAMSPCTLNTAILRLRECARPALLARSKWLTASETIFDGRGRVKNLNQDKLLYSVQAIALPVSKLSNTGGHGDSDGRPTNTVPHGNGLDPTRTCRGFSRLKVRLHSDELGPFAFLTCT